MNGSDHPHGDARTQEEMLAKLGGALDRLPHPVDVHLFAQPGDGEIFSRVARQALSTFGGLSDRLRIYEQAPDGPEAARHGIDRFPTLLLAPDRYRIRWHGAPMGEEGRTFIELLFLVGAGDSGLSEDSRRMLKSLDATRDLMVFVSPSCPYCPQQAVNAARAAVERPDLVSLTLIDTLANPDLAEQHGAQSVPMTFADEILIGQGAQGEEVFVQSLRKLEEQRIYIPDIEADRVETDLLIVGGGPAGLTAGIYARRAGLRTALVEQGVLGGQVATTPVVENYPGFTSVGGKTLVDILVQHALQYVQIFQGEMVTGIEVGHPFTVRTSRRTFTVNSVLLATGATHRRLGVPGENRLSGRGVSYCATCDGPLFKGRKVILVGGGNSAVTEALYLHHMGVSVTLVHRRDTLRAQAVLARNLTDNKIPVLWNTEVREIRGTARVEAVVLYNNRTGATSTFDTDGVFIAIGYQPAVSLAEAVGVKLTPDGYIAKDDRHRTSVPGIYSAGDVEGGYKQIVTAAGQGAEAAMSIFEDLINPYWKRDADA